jgi:hypothetical protein
LNSLKGFSENGRQGKVLYEPDTDEEFVPIPGEKF